LNSMLVPAAQHAQHAHLASICQVMRCTLVSRHAAWQRNASKSRHWYPHQLPCVVDMSLHDMHCTSCRLRSISVWHVKWYLASASLAQLAQTRRMAYARWRPCCAGALERASISPALVQEVFMGNVCSANLGQVGRNSMPATCRVNIS
jgi:hypothetical protein